MSDFTVQIERHEDGRVSFHVKGDTPIFIGPVIEGVPMMQGNCVRYFPGETATFEPDTPLRIADEQTVLNRVDPDKCPAKNHFNGQHHEGGRSKTHSEGDNCPPCPDGKK